MNYTSTGQGPAVILIHGLFGNLDNLKNLSNSLESHNQVIRVDVPNHGLSPHWPTMNYPALAKAMIELMDELSIEKAHLVGHSMGGKIAMATALSYPDRIASLIAADIAPVSYQNRHSDVFDALQNVDLSQLESRAQALNSLTASGIDAGTAQFLLKNLTRDETSFKWKMNLSGLLDCYPDMIAWYNNTIPAKERYTGPSLFIRGGDSDYVTASHRAAIMAQFPNVQAKTIEGAGHWLHAQKPVIFNRIVSEFIQKHESK
ncbi:alpha/beta fold hydrolase [Shewanella woodyi]|uniref:Alpha/beta hydrolase fold n=1 Tax=Shewanella woodyi (strain ATCC 51908 / MS32) TaxID=392500 RepID=B1KEH6_SHEWM|nr:alpha/beta fold hydrolase [Shewanella woodyi]ACA86554.1 alpha/beta hydrolase fold [Shewanella woodyi ATCC 51908]